MRGWGGRGSSPAVSAPTVVASAPAGGARRSRPGATAALALLTVVTALGMGRLFRGTSYVGPVLVGAVTAHAAAWAGRRLRLPAPVAVVCSLAALVLAVVWTVLPQTTTWGLPSAQSFSVAGSELARAQTDFQLLQAPAPATPGFVLLSEMAVGLVALLADWAAFRVRATLEALIPSFALFVFTSALGASAGRAWSVAAYLAGVLLFLLAEEADRRSAGELGKRARRQLRGSLVRNGCLLGALAVVAAATVGPSLPGAAAPALISWHNQDSAAPNQRTTVSPLVDIKSRLTGQSRTEMFTVSATYASYWRLTALDTFDGTVWSSDASYQRASGHLPGASPGAGRSTRDTFSVRNLDSVWLPAAFRPVALTAASASYNPRSSSIIGNRATSDGLSYTVSSVLPTFTTGELASVRSDRGDPSLRNDLALPSSLPPQIAQIARQAVKGETSPYGKALALQQFFRGGRFTYSLSVSEGDDNQALLTFLTKTHAGFCQQFAGAYAVMARAVGIPARVAVGFTPGVKGPDGRYHVYGTDAHAWPEVYLDRFGWVPFEPTPSRGAPGAEAYTGVTPAQAPSPVSVTTSSVGPAPSPAGGGAGVSSLARGLSNLVASGNGGGSSPARAPGGGAPIGWIALFALAFVMLARGTVVPASRWRRRRRRRARAAGAQRVLVAWEEAAEALSRAGTSPRPSETYGEFAERAARQLPSGATDLTTLAGAATVARYSPHPLPSRAVTDAMGCSTHIEEAVRGQARLIRRLAWVLDPRGRRPADAAVSRAGGSAR